MKPSEILLLIEAAWLLGPPIVVFFWGMRQKCDAEAARLLCKVVR